jgi:hypothetical protein
VFFSGQRRLDPRCVFQGTTVVEAAHVRNLLESAGIGAELKNDRLWSALGEIPVLEAWPQVWVVDERDAESARRVLRELERGPASPSWTCPGCDEWLEGQFTACWRCGHDRPPPREPEPRAGER